MEGEKVHIRHVMLWEFKQGSSAMATAEKICSVYGGGLISDRAVRNWFAKFRAGETTLKDEPRSGRLSSFDDNLLDVLLEQNSLQSTRDIAEQLNTSQSTICRHLRKLGKVNNIAEMPRGKNDNKPRGRMTAYAFFVQTCREEHKKKHPDENVVFAEFSKKCAERWKTMLDKEKRRFHEMAEKDKLRYDTEMQNYVPSKAEKRGKKRKHIKDPNAPKRSLSAFFWFCNDERPKVKAINPEYGVGDVAKELGRRWAEADPETKSKYEAMAEKDKARYDREMTAYKKKPKSSADDDEDDEMEEDDDEDEDE